jgi:hypothetical protein
MTEGRLPTEKSKEPPDFKEGDRVVYMPRGGMAMPENGEVTKVGLRFVFVRFDGENWPKATAREDLSLEESKEPECDGRCLQGYDIGLPSGSIAYPDPYCSLHGDGRESKMVCIGCKQHPDEIREYTGKGKELGVTPEEFVKLEEGTYNPVNGHFWCTACYINAGMPNGVAP